MCKQKLTTQPSWPLHIQVSSALGEFLQLLERVTFLRHPTSLGIALTFFLRWATGSHRQATRFELNFFP